MSYGVRKLNDELLNSVTGGSGPDKPYTTFSTYGEKSIGNHVEIYYSNGKRSYDGSIEEIKVNGDGFVRFKVRMDSDTSYSGWYDYEHICGEDATDYLDCEAFWSFEYY